MNTNSESEIAAAKVTGTSVNDLGTQESSTANPEVDTTTKKRKGLTSKAPTNPSKSRKPAGKETNKTSSTGNSTMDVESDSGSKMPERPTTDDQKFNFNETEGEVDGLISIEAIRIARGIKISAGAPADGDQHNPILHEAFQLALELNKNKTPIFATTLFLMAKNVDANALIALPYRKSDKKLITNIFTLSEAVGLEAKKIASLICTNLPPSVTGNASTELLKSEILEFIVSPDDMVAVLDNEGLQIISYLIQEGRARRSIRFDNDSFSIHLVAQQKGAAKSELSDFDTNKSKGAKSEIIQQAIQASRTVPIFEDKHAIGNQFAARMFAATTFEIEKSAAHEKQKAERASKQEMTTHSSTKIANSYGASGGSLNLLYHMSIAAYTAKHQTTAQVAFKICNRTLCATSPVTVHQLINSWALPTKHLSYLGRLEWRWGQDRAHLRMQMYQTMEGTIEYSADYLALIAGDGDIGGDMCTHINTIPYLKIKLENLLLTIFASTNMRFKYQIAMLQSLDRFIDFLSSHDMGVGNPVMSKMIETSTTQYLSNLNYIKFQIDSNVIHTEDDILSLFDSIPDLSPEGRYMKLQLHLSLTDTFGSTAMLIQQAENSSAGRTGPSQSNNRHGKSSDNVSSMQHNTALTALAQATPTQPEAPSKQNSRIKRQEQIIRDKNERLREAENTIKQLTHAARQTNRQLATDAAPSPGRTNTTAAGNTNAQNSPNPTARAHCAFFNSTRGCNRNNCKLIHRIPSKNSAEWKFVLQQHEHFKLQASTEFNIH